MLELARLYFDIIREGACSILLGLFPQGDGVAREPWKTVKLSKGSLAKVTYTHAAVQKV